VQIARQVKEHAVKGQGNEGGAVAALNYASKNRRSMHQ
jgi:hypothetical protein